MITDELNLQFKHEINTNFSGPKFLSLKLGIELPGRQILRR